MEWVDRLQTAGIVALVAGVVGSLYWFDILGSPTESSQPEQPFDCTLRRMMVLELEAIHEQRLVTSLEHRGIVLELRENPDPDYGGFSLLWSRGMEPESTSCIIVTGKKWSWPNGMPSLVQVDFDPFATDSDAKP